MSDHNFCTPPELLAKVRLLDPKRGIGLDPCSNGHSMVSAWFHNFAIEFPVRLFLKGRPRFWLNGAPMPGPGKFASMLIYAGNKPELFKSIFGEMGWVV